MPDCGAPLLLLGMCGERCIHLREVAIVGDISGLTTIIELLLMMMMRLLWHHKLLLISNLNRLRLIIASVVIIAVDWRMLWVRNQLMMLMEGRELHWRLTWRDTASKRWWVSEGQWGRFWT